LELNEPKQLIVPLAESAADVLEQEPDAAMVYRIECGNRMRVAKFYALNRRDD